MDYDILLQKLASAFKSHNYELFLVGGAVRDELRGQTPHEFDLTTDAPPGKIKIILSALKPTATYTVGEKFGTIGAIFNTSQVEITTYRGEKYIPGNRHPEVTFGKDLIEDLSRRDFTINAIAKNLETKSYIDPFHGQEDLDDKLIRVAGEKAERFQEDPLRLLRAVRFAVTLDFAIDPHTTELIKETTAELASISSERIAQEMDKMLVAKKPSQGIILLTELNLLPYILPEFIALQTIQHELDEHKDIYEHTLTVLDNVPNTKRLRWLALLHDIAKPQTKSIEQGEVHFHGHEVVGERMARQILERLHYDRQFINEVTQLIRMHLRVNLFDKTWTDGAIRRLMREAGDLLDDLISFSYADITSARPEKVSRGHRRIDEFKSRVEKIREQEEVEKIKSPLSGTELMELFKHPAGPWIQKIKDYLLELVLEGELKQEDKETARQLAKAYIQKNPL